MQKKQAVAKKKEQITLPPLAARGSHVDTGKGWRLVNPNLTRTLKASVLKTFSSGGQRFAVVRIVT